MLIPDKIIINVTNQIKSYYSSFGYDVNNKTIEIDVNDIMSGSSLIVECKCDNCGIIKNVQYRNYYKSKSLYNKYYCCKCCHLKSEMTYSVKNNIKCIFQDKDFINDNKKRSADKRTLRLSNKKLKKNHRKEILNLIKQEKLIEECNKIHNNKYDYSLVKYVGNKIKVEIICNICGKHFFQSPSNHKNLQHNCSFCGGKYEELNMNVSHEYKILVRRETYKHKKKLVENWDGKDFYDDEYIKDYFLLKPCDNNYPNIDHKISIKFGFDNNISPTIIGNIDNLCITKRIINLKKSAKNGLGL